MSARQRSIRWDVRARPAKQVSDFAPTDGNFANSGSATAF
jgi:hypothetical protein